MQAYGAALDFKLAGLAQAIDRRHVEAKLVRRGLAIEVVPGQPGRRLDQKAAGASIVRTLARLDRGQPVALPVRIDPIEVTAADLAPAARQARIALSAPVRLQHEETRWKLPRWRIAELLSLPVAGETQVAIAGPGAEAWFDKLRKTVERAPVDADLRRSSRAASTIVPDKPGLGIDVPATAKALLAAATSSTARTAELAVRTTAAERTTAEAKAMGITGVVGSYYTTYGGIPSRLHNVALVAQLIDGALIAPGKTFSFNGTTGERTAEKGFQEAPVIINGELQTGLGGGICQVSTTVFNAAYEAGLADRRAHESRALHLALPARARRDGQLSRSRPQVHERHRQLAAAAHVRRLRLADRQPLRNASEPARRVDRAAAPRRRRAEGEARPRPHAAEGQERGVWSTASRRGRRASAAPSTTPNGTVLHEDTWYSSYRSEPKVVRVGTKPKPKPKPKPEPPKSDPLDPSATDAVPDAPPASSPRP